MAQALHLMNAPEIAQKVGDPMGRVTRLVKAGKTPSEIVEELCLAAFGRVPSERELAVAKKLFAESPKSEAASDLLWALLNSYDFLFER